MLIDREKPGLVPGFLCFLPIIGAGEAIFTLAMF
jgi:hypothetical protein